MEGVQRCPACGSDNAAGQRFCGSCGAALTIVCPSCEAVNDLAASYCGSCGSKLELSDLADTQREERRTATILFADFSGFTSLSERRDPEEVKLIGSHITRQMGDMVVRYGGTVVNVLGDGIMAVFGAPTAHEDDAERAVRCALRMVKEIGPPPDSGVQGSLHVGVNTGLVMAGVVGPPEHREYAVMGDVTNTAARLEGAATSGQVLVGADTYVATRGAIDFEELEPIVAKGKRKPVAAWRAVRARGAPSARRISRAPLVGRADQLELLRNLWEQARRGSLPALVTVLGEAGIGKSRLVHELVTGLGSEVSVLRGRSLPYGEATGYDAFLGVVRSAAGIETGDADEVARGKLATLVGGVIPGPASANAIERLSVLIGLDREGAPDRQPLYGAARDVIEALARVMPTILLFEDVHWASPSMLALIEFLAGRLRDAPILLVTTARPTLIQARPSWGGGLTRYVSVELEPLSDDDARDLVRSLLPPSDAAGEALERLVAAGGGNPLFLEEFTASVAEPGGHRGEMPATVQSVIAARIDSLPRRDRDVLLAASVAGRVFSRGTVATLADREVDEALESLEMRDFVRREPGSLAREPTFVFKHILMADVAYEILPRAERPTLHATAAGHLESQGPDRMREEAAVIARHWRMAGEPARAVPHLLVAADGASRAWAKERAIELYAEALDLGGDEGDRATIDHALLGRARALLATNDFGTTTLSDIERAMASTDPVTRATATELRARLAYWSGDALGARHHAEAARELARGVSDAAVESRALGLLGEVRAMAGELEEAERLSLEGASRWPSGGRDGNYAYTCTMLALIHYWRGSYPTALEWAEAGYRTGVETSHLAATIQGAAQASLALAGASRYEEALTWAERAVGTGKEWEPTPQLTSRAMNIWAGTLREMGDLDGSRGVCHEAEELARSASFPGARISAGIDLLTLDLMQGHITEAEKRLPGLLEEADATRGWHQWLFGGRLAEAQARLDLYAGRTEDAVAAADHALALARGKGRRKYECMSLVTLGEALLAVGKLSDAQDVLRRSVREAEELGHAPAISSSSAAYAALLERIGKDEEAASVRARAGVFVANVAASLADAHRAAFLEHLGGPDSGADPGRR
jgi:class 3 adenylate cyclase/tetratricopeptide (TPR) repeat protein